MEHDRFPVSAGLRNLFAVVRCFRHAMGGLFLVVAVSCSFRPVATEPVECWYCAAAPDSEVERYENCAEEAGGTLRFTPEHLARIRFDSHGLATARVGDRHHYIRPDGAMLAVLTCDNWADDFSEGLVRSRVCGKIAYYNDRFERVIAPRYDWGWPFARGRALVCRGCRVQPGDADSHREVSGGVWGYIDAQGNEVVPVALTRDDALKR